MVACHSANALLDLLVAVSLLLSAKHSLGPKVGIIITWRNEPFRIAAAPLVGTWGIKPTSALANGMGNHSIPSWPSLSLSLQLSRDNLVSQGLTGFCSPNLRPNSAHLSAGRLGRRVLRRCRLESRVPGAKGQGWRLPPIPPRKGSSQTNWPDQPRCRSEVLPLVPSFVL